MEHMQTWKIVPKSSVPKGAKILRSKFVLKIKRFAKGAIDMFKERLVVLSNIQ